MTPSEIPPPRPAPHGRTAVVEQLRDRWADPRVRIGALLVVAAIAGFAWYQNGRSEASALRAIPRPRPDASRAPARATTTVPPVLVHVAGAVVRPGLVRVATGARVADAIAAAGGAVPGADLDRLNLAAKVADGQRILVVAVGAPAGGDPGGTTDAGGAAADGGAPGDGAPVNLNTATTDDLDGLPGIGPTLAAAILRERERRGGFTSVDQLRDVRGIGEKRFADLRDLVTV
jgi:competence protein ComEA